MLLVALQDEAEPIAAASGDWRPAIHVLMIALPGIAVVITLVGWAQLKSFLSSHTRMASRGDLADLHALATRHLLLARILRPLLLAGTPLLIVLFIRGEFEMIDLAWSIGPSLVSLAIGLAMRPTQRAVETLPIEDDLRRKRDQIVEGWHGGGNLPDV